MTVLSLEFFPPKTDRQRAQFDSALPKLRALEPEYASVTFGAGGSTLSYTPQTVKALMDAGLDAAPHLSCMGGTREEIATLLDEYKAMGCTRLVALRGDMPSGMAGPGDFIYASELVSFIREHAGDHFHVEVACYPETHPQADDALVDMRHFRHKVECGANGAITQYFFNPDAYFRFVEDARAAGIEVPIVPGIMPISNFTQLKRFSDRLRRGDPALDRQAHAGLLRRRRQRARAGRGHRRGDVPAPAGGRRAGPAHLHAQPRDGDAGGGRTPALRPAFSPGRPVGV